MATDLEEIIEAAKDLDIGGVLDVLSGNAPEEPNFWRDNKNWLIPTGIGVGTLGGLALVAAAMKKKN